MNRSHATVPRSVGVAGALLLGLAAAIVVPAPAQAATAEFQKESQWAGGYVGKMTVRNDEATAITAWRVVLELPADTTIGHQWGALLVRQGANRYVFDSLPWNGRLDPGASVTFGFIASGSGAPVSCTVNGGPCAGQPVAQDVSPPTMPGNLRSTTGSQTFTLSWDPSTDDRGVVEYEIFANGSRMATTTDTSYTMPIPPPAVFAFGVRAVDAARNASPFAFRGLGTPVDTEPPTTPTGLVMGMSDGYFTLTWTASRDNVMVAGYEVTLNDQPVARLSSTTAYARFPGGYGEFILAVRAFDPAGNVSPAAWRGIAIDPPPPTPPASAR